MEQFGNSPTPLKKQCLDNLPPGKNLRDSKQRLVTYLSTALQTALGAEKSKAKTKPNW